MYRLCEEFIDIWQEWSVKMELEIRLRYCRTEASVIKWLCWFKSKNGIDFEASEL